MNHVEKIVRDANYNQGMMIPLSDKAKTKRSKHERKVKEQIKDCSFDME